MTQEVEVQPDLLPEIWSSGAETAGVSAHRITPREGGTTKHSPRQPQTRARMPPVYQRIGASPVQPTPRSPVATHRRRGLTRPNTAALHHRCIDEEPVNTRASLGPSPPHYISNGIVLRRVRRQGYRPQVSHDAVTPLHDRNSRASPEGERRGLAGDLSPAPLVPRAGKSRRIRREGHKSPRDRGSRNSTQRT